MFFPNYYSGSTSELSRDEVNKHSELHRNNKYNKYYTKHIVVTKVRKWFPDVVMLTVIVMSGINN